MASNRLNQQWKGISTGARGVLGDQHKIVLVAEKDCLIKYK